VKRPIFTPLFALGTVRRWGNRLAIAPAAVSGIWPGEAEHPPPGSQRLNHSLWVGQPRSTVLQQQLRAAAAEETASLGGAVAGSYSAGLTVLVIQCWCCCWVVPQADHHFLGYAAAYCWYSASQYKAAVCFPDTHLLVAVPCLQVVRTLFYV
jgi:hypothetical protein